MSSDDSIDDLNWLRARAEELREAGHIRGRSDPQRLATFVFELSQGSPGYAAARKAGYSPGNARSEEEKRKNLAATASRLRRTPAVQKLTTELGEHQSGRDGGVMMPDELARILSETARRGHGTERMQAARQLAELHRQQGREVGRHDSAAIVQAMLAPQRPPLLRVLAGAMVHNSRKSGGDAFADIRLPKDVERVVREHPELAFSLEGIHAARGSLEEGTQAPGAGAVGGAAAASRTAEGGGPA